MTSSLAQLPEDCLRLVLGFCIKHDSHGPPGVTHLVRLRSVCRIFDSVAMSLLCDSAWFWRTQNNYEIQKLLDRARMKRLTGSCQFPLGRDASAFIASCVLRKPKDITEPPTANLFTLINSVVDRILSDQQLDSDAPERFEYTMRLCRASIPTENSYDDHIAIWHALSPKAQSLFFPVDDIISHASFDMHVLVAKVIVQNPNVEHEIRSLFLQKGRKALSIHWKRSKRTVFGGFLAAAIRGSNLDILCFLLAHDVDISRVKTGHGQKREQYDDYFLRLAVTVGDPAVLDTLLEQRLFKIPSNLIQRAVCFGHVAVAERLLGYYAPDAKELDSEHFITGFPSTQKYEEHLYDCHDSKVSKLLRKLLKEACHHRDVALVRALLSHPRITKGPDFVGAWNRFFPTVSEYYTNYNYPLGLKLNDYHETSPVSICVTNGDLDILRLLLDRGMNPHARPFYVRTAKRLHGPPLPHDYVVRATSWALEVCIARGDKDMARLLFNADFRLETVEWLDLAEAFSSLDKTSDTETKVGGVTSVVEFWGWMADEGWLNPVVLLEECQDIEAEQDSSKTVKRGRGNKLEGIEAFLQKCFQGRLA